MKKTGIVLTIIAANTTALFAHGGVKNPAVMARMEGMSAIAAQMKILGQMAKGATEFDQAVIDAALAELAQHAADTPALFAAQEDDPKSEALPAIWQDFDDFTAQAMELNQIAMDLQGKVSSLDDLRPAMGQLGQTCKTCHQDYRK